MRTHKLRAIRQQLGGCSSDRPTCMQIQPHQTRRTTTHQMLQQRIESVQAESNLPPHRRCSFLWQVTYKPWMIHTGCLQPCDLVASPTPTPTLTPRPLYNLSCTVSHWFASTLSALQPHIFRVPPRPSQSLRASAHPHTRALHKLCTLHTQYAQVHLS
jgi:hypothetical protein